MNDAPTITSPRRAAALAAAASARDQYAAQFLAALIGEGRLSIWEITSPQPHHQKLVGTHIRAALHLASRFVGACLMDDGGISPDGPSLAEETVDLGADLGQEPPF